MIWSKNTTWSANEMERLREVVGRLGCAWKRVSREIPGRSPHACKHAYNTRERQRRLEAHPAVTAAAEPKHLKTWQDRRARERAAEQERVAALVQEQERSVTAAFLGDPLPGRSALDRKRAGIVDPEYFDRRMVRVPKKPTLYTGARS